MFLLLSPITFPFSYRAFVLFFPLLYQQLIENDLMFPFKNIPQYSRIILLLEYASFSTDRQPIAAKIYVVHQWYFFLNLVLRWTLVYWLLVCVLGRDLHTLFKGPRERKELLRRETRVALRWGHVIPTPVYQRPRHVWVELVVRFHVLAQRGFYLSTQAFISSERRSLYISRPIWH